MTISKIELPATVKNIIHLFESHGYEAYLVGGCVRDMMLGRKPHDWDITTSANTAEMRQLFGEKAIPTGEKYGTMTIDGVECTTYRKDGDYTDGRHPDTIEYSKSLIDDLSRRDFTMNAMAYHPEKGIIDEFGGMDSINAKLIRTVGDPEKRFSEDALRILRAIRFSVQLGFNIEQETGNAIIAGKDNLSMVSRERIQAELRKMLSYDQLHIPRVKSEYPVFPLMTDRAFTEIICTCILALRPCVGFSQQNKYHSETVFEHIISALLAYNDDGNDFIVRLALLLHDVGKPKCFSIGTDGYGHFYDHASVGADIAYYALHDLKFDRDTIEKVCQLIRYHNDEIAPSKKSVRRYLGMLGEAQFFRWIALKLADRKTHVLSDTSDLEKCREIARQIIDEGECFKLSDLAIKGGDIVALGLKPSPMVGKFHQDLFERVVAGELPNDKEVLLNEAKKMVAKTRIEVDLRYLAGNLQKP